jgi:amidophosphoribosyltransferase
MAATKELIAHDKTEAEVADAIGADELIYQSLDDLISSVQEGNPEIKDFETSIFTGNYPTQIEEGYLENLEEERSDIIKMSKQEENKT